MSIEASEPVFEQQMQDWLEAFPAVCRGCTVAKTVLQEMIEEGSAFNSTRAAECIDGPTKQGQCSTEKVVCRHPAAGEPTIDNDQVDSLKDYLSLK